MFANIVAAFIIAVLSGMGVGSAGLFVIYLTSFVGTPQIIAQGLNLLFYLFACGASLLFHAKKRTFFPTLILWLIFAAVPGVVVGGLLTSVLPVEYIRKFFGIMLIGAGFSTIFRALFSAKRAKKKNSGNSRD